MDTVARYYDRNTGRFLLVGRGRDTRSIHRELWGPGVASSEEAARFVDGLVADEIEERTPGGPRRVVDFGCGVGGTLAYLAERFPSAELRGITISGRQAQLAARLLSAARLEGRCSCLLGDFHRDRVSEKAEAVVAIESLAHSPDLPAVLANASEHLGTGGILVVVDDFLAADEVSLGGAERRWIARLRDGWRLPGLGTVERLTGLAGREGLLLLEDRDLSAYTRPGTRVRDRLLSVCGPVLSRLRLARMPLFGNMVGGNALQVGLREGFIEYHLLVFGRRPTAA